MNKKIFSAIVIFTGTVVGAGIFGIPYVVASIGFFPGVIYLIILGAVLCVVMLTYGEITLRTKKFHQSAGYAHKYLGKWGKLAMSFSLIFGIYGALLAYMIGIGDFLFTLLGDYLGGSPILYSTIFFIMGSAAIMFGLGMVIKMEKGMFLLLLVAAMLIFILGFSKVDLNNFTTLNLANIFLPFGVILFAYSGFSAIPDMSRVLDGSKKNLKKAIIIGTVIVVIVYLAFTFIIVGISGKDTSEEAIVGLKGILGSKIVIIGAIFGILAMATSFLTLGLALKEVYNYDYGVDKTLAWVLTCFIPFILLILGLSSFIDVLGIVGSLTGGISSILILAMHKKAQKSGDRKPEYSLELSKSVIYLLYIIFILGIIYQIYYLFLK